MWRLATSEYRVYRLFESRPHVSTEIHTLPYLFASIFNTPPAVRVKIEHGMNIVMHLFYSSDGDEPVHSIFMIDPSSSSLGPPSEPPSCKPRSHVIFPHPLPNPSFPLFNVFVLLFLCPVGKTSLRNYIITPYELKR